MSSDEGFEMSEEEYEDEQVENEDDGSDEEIESDIESGDELGGEIERDAGTAFNHKKKLGKGEMFISDMLDESDSDDEDDGKYENIDALVDSLTGSKKRKLRERTEHSTEEGFALGNGSSDLNFSTLIESINEESGQDSGLLKKHLTDLEKSSKLNTFTSTVKAKRAERKVAYDEAKKNISAWNRQVDHERMKRTVDFSDKKGFYENDVKDLRQITKKETQKKSKLENEINEILEKHGMKTEEDIIHKEDKQIISLLEGRTDYTEEDVKNELEKRRHEQRKVRALMFYMEQKNKRHNKIKSKEFRRHQRKQQRKQEENDEGQDADVNRAKERATLRHKNNSRFITGLLKHGGLKRSEFKEVIETRLRKEGELKKRKKELFNNGDESESSDEEAEEIEEGEKKGLMGMDFMESAMKRKQEEEEREGKQEEFLGRRSFQKVTKEIDPKEKKENPWLQEERKEKSKKKASFKINNLEFNLENEDEEDLLVVKSKAKEKDVEKEKKEEEKKVKRDKQKELLRRAFVLGGSTKEEFKEERLREEEEKEQKKLDKLPSMAGWGSWTGPGMITKKRKVDSAKLKKKIQPVMINEQKALKEIEKFQVEKVPFPFTSRKEYERSLMTPLGSEWNTLSAHVSLNKPEVILGHGKVIKPIQKASD